MKYRIITNPYLYGEVGYIPQFKRIGIWFSFKDWQGMSKEFNTHKEAVNFIEAQIEYTKTTSNVVYEITG